MSNLEIPEGWEVVEDNTTIDANAIPQGWEEVAEEETYGKSFGGDEVVNPVVKTGTLEAYENENKSFFDKLVEKTADYLKIGGSAVQDVANVVAPVGEVNFMGENYTNPITGVEGNESVANRVLKDGDFALEDYNKINQLAKTGMSLTLDDKEGLDTYNKNLGDLVVNSFGFDEFGTGEDGKYYAIKDGVQTQINQDSLKTIFSDVYGDKMEILGSILGAKKGYDLGKNFGTKGKLAGGLIGGGIGASTGTILDLLDSSIQTGEKLSAAQYGDELAKSAALDVGAGVIVGGAVKGLSKGSEVLKDVNPFTVEKRAKAYQEDVLGTTAEDVVKKSNEVETLANDFGGVENQDLTKLSSQDETQKVLSDLYENSVESRKANVQDSEALTTNLFNKLDVNEIKEDAIGTVNDKISGNIKENVSGIENYWDDLYTQTRSDIQTIAGNENIAIKPKSVDEINKAVKSLKTLENVQKKNISKKGLNEFENDYASMLDLVGQNLKQDVEVIGEDGVARIVKEDVDSYTLTGMMDLQRKFNDFYYKHSDKLTGQQKKNLTTIKTTIYDDIENYIGKKFEGEADVAKEVTDKWKSVNEDYGSWLKSKSRHKILDDIVKDNVDINELTKNIISKNGDINKQGLDTFGSISYQLSKTNPEKLDNFYGSLVNNLLENSKVYDVEFGKDVRFLDFEKFNKTYDSLKGQAFNSALGRTAKGRKILKTLDDFRTISKNEEKIQNAIFKGQTPLSESARTSTNNTRDFLFGVAYAIRHRLLGFMSDKIFKADAFNTIVTDMSKKRRYSLKDFDNSIKTIEMKNNKLPTNKKLDPAEVKRLKDIRVEINEIAKDREAEYKELEKVMKNIKDEKVKRQLAEDFRKESEQYIKDNMLIEYKGNIPKVQIKEGATSPVDIEIQDRLNVANTKKPSSKKIETKPTTFEEFTTKTGIDKDVIVSKVELDKQLEELKQSPYYDEVVFNGANTYAKDARYKNIKHGDVRYEKEEVYGQGNENGYNKIDATYTPNDKYGAVLTKQDINNLEKGKISDDLIQKIKSEIEERTELDRIAQEQIDADFKKADDAGEIPFSHPIAGSGAGGAALGSQTDLNNDGTIDEVDIAIGALAGVIGMSATMKMLPALSKMTSEQIKLLAQTGTK